MRKEDKGVGFRVWDSRTTGGLLSATKPYCFVGSYYWFPVGAILKMNMFNPYWVLLYQNCKQQGPRIYPLKGPYNKWGFGRFR